MKQRLFLMLLMALALGSWGCTAGELARLETAWPAAPSRWTQLSSAPIMYVRRSGLRLREAPERRARSIERLRVNDQVKLLEQNPQGWARVGVERTRRTGWIEMRYLSPTRVAYRPKRKPAAPKGAEEASEKGEGAQVEAPAGTPEEKKGVGSILGPAPAEAAPPPAEKTIPVPTAKPEMFEPF